MRFLFVFICVFLTLRADFLGSIYMELKELNLSREQQIQIRNIMRYHHSFLRQWYIDFKKNNDDDDIMESFSNSSLSPDSAIISDSINLENERVRAERSFLISVYEILNKEQRATFGARIKERENYSRILQDKFEDSQKLHQSELSSDLFGDIKR